MSRSLKKGPFVEAKLFGKIAQMNEKGEKQVVKTWSRASTIFPVLLVIPSRSMTAESMCLCISRRIWSATSSASLHRREPLKAMRAAKHPITENKSGAA